MVGVAVTVLKLDEDVNAPEPSATLAKPAGLLSVTLYVAGPHIAKASSEFVPNLVVSSKVTLRPWRTLKTLPDEIRS